MKHLLYGVGIYFALLFLKAREINAAIAAQGGVYFPESAALIAAKRKWAWLPDVIRM